MLSLSLSHTHTHTHTQPDADHSLSHVPQTDTRFTVKTLFRLSSLEAQLLQSPSARRGRTWNGGTQKEEDPSTYRTRAWGSAASAPAQCPPPWPGRTCLVCSLREGQRLLSPDHGRGRHSAITSICLESGRQSPGRQPRQASQLQAPRGHGPFPGRNANFYREEAAMGERAAFSFLPSTFQDKHVHISPRV